MSLILPEDGSAKPDYNLPRALHVPAGKGVTKWVSGDVYEVKATAETTNGTLGFIDAWVPPGNGPVAHVHNSSDESFYIISGALEILNGTETFVAEAGDFVFVPRGTRHRFRNLTDEQTRMVFLLTPGGVEALFTEGGEDPVPGGKPEFWTTERFLEQLPLIERIDSAVLPEEADLPADGL
ncbi:MAG TPA: cupin domain-containing protein [Pseudonocardiaceae bacterium]|nr:cupin domain-containing protein [Pseudonocardiaceae bacterium]